MMLFKSKLILESLQTKTRLFSLAQSFDVCTTATGTPLEISVPKGYVTDLATVPSLFSFVVENDSPVIIRPAVVHDDLYSCRGKLPSVTLTRAQADAILVDGMKTLGANALQRNAVWCAVRVFGWQFWRDKETPATSSPMGLPAFASLRSHLWPKYREAFLKEYPICAWCGAASNLQVHHIKPVHVYPELELVTSNFITLCEHPLRRCHFLRGHLGNWNSWNPNILTQAPYLT